jgi:hypothetical protein
VQDMPPQVRKAVLAGDWKTAMDIAGAGAALWNAILADVVNLARTVGELSDPEVAQMRGTSASAVNQRFGPRAHLLRQKMQEELEQVAQQDEQDDA